MEKRSSNLTISCDTTICNVKSQQDNVAFLYHVEDKKLVNICLEKVDKSAENVWKSLIVGQYEADPFVFDQMQQKMTLERFQTEV